MERKLIAAAVSSALALPMAAQAIDFNVSGHVNRALVLEDQDGNPKDGELQNKDSNASASRFRFTGSEDLGNGLTAGVQMELAVLSNDSGTTRAKDGEGLSGTGTRHANVYLGTPGGKITLGKGSSATDGMTNARLGGPSWLGGVTNWCAYATPTLKRRNPTAPDDPSKDTVVATAAACQTHDPGRQQVLRYDSPALGPATISASMGNDDYKDIEATFSGSVGDSAYDLRIGYVGENDSNDDDIVGASGAVKFAMGTAVAVAWASTDRGAGDDNSYTHFEIDHSYGDGSVGAYYKTGESNGVDGSLWGIGVGHNIGGGATVYAGYRHTEDDYEGFADHNLFVAGMRVTFK